ncbi:MAG: glycosyltransferase family 4 protein [Saprospiraceae bacterium]|nr:glycosyltransferase family 4 protein [Saprospiraceae bacterium]
MRQGRIHIAIVANTTWNIHNFRLPVIDAILAKGWHVSVIAPVDEFIGYRDSYPTVRHYDVRYLIRDSVNPIADAQFIRELNALYRKIRPDLVIHYTHKPNVYGGLVCKIIGIPSIAVITGLGYPFLRKGFLRFVIQQLYRMTSRCHSAAIFENEDDREFFEQHKLTLAPIAVSVKGCGVNTRHFQPQALPSSSEKLTFLFLGRLLYDKGIVEYVKAAAIVKQQDPGIRCVVAGQLDDGNPSTVSKSDLLSWIQSGHIEYAGHLQDVRQAIASSDCVVLPSLREAIPRSLTEAMAMARPVITTRTAGCREAVIEGKNGFLVPVGDEQALAAAMLEMTRLTHSQREKMGSEGRSMAENFLDDRLIARKIVQVLDQVLQRT